MKNFRKNLPLCFTSDDAKVLARRLLPLNLTQRRWAAVMQSVAIRGATQKREMTFNIFLFRFLKKCRQIIWCHYDASAVPVEKWIGWIFFLCFSSLNFLRTGSLIGTWKEEQNVCMQFYQKGFHCCCKTSMNFAK